MSNFANNNFSEDVYVIMLSYFLRKEIVMKNNALKQLALKAKKRLSTVGQTISGKQTSACLSQTTYAIVANLQDIKEDPLYEKVKKLMSRDDIFNPIAELTDHKVFDKLSSLEKEKYVINISKRYNELREYFLKNGY